MVQGQGSNLCCKGVGVRTSYWVVLVFLLYLNSLIFIFFTSVNPQSWKEHIAVW